MVLLAFFSFARIFEAAGHVSPGFGFLLMTCHGLDLNFAESPTKLFFMVLH